MKKFTLKVIANTKQRSYIILLENLTEIELKPYISKLLTSTSTIDFTFEIYELKSENSS